MIRSSRMARKSFQKPMGEKRQSLSASFRIFSSRDPARSPESCRSIKRAIRSIYGGG